VVSEVTSTEPVGIAEWSRLADREPADASIHAVDVKIMRYHDLVPGLHSRRLHRGALLNDGSLTGDNLICGLHGWDHRFRRLARFVESSHDLTAFDRDMAHLSGVACRGAEPL